jgi:uncharacterized protein (DUF1330 family)
MSAPVFLIADTRVINEAKYEAYRSAISAAVLAHGGRFLAHDQQPRAIEGDWNPSHMMIAEFASAVAAEAFHAADDFRQAFDLSHNCAMVDMVLVNGIKVARHAGGSGTPAYAVADSHVVNRARFQELSQAINDAVHSYQGRHLAWSDHSRTIAGNWTPPLLTLIEFPDYDGALVNYASESYRKTHELLSNAAMISLLLLRGAGADAG